MADFKRLFFSTPSPSKEEPEINTPTPSPEQWASMFAALDLDADASVDEFVAKVLDLAEAPKAAPTLDVEQVEQIAAAAAKQAVTIDAEQIAAAAAASTVTIDTNTWNDMKKHLEVGVKASTQQHRVEAEQVVDQAIRLGKASSTRREDWIAAYNADKEKTMKALNAAKEIPRIEIGHSLTLEQLEEKQRNSWVR